MTKPNKIPRTTGRNARMSSKRKLNSSDKAASPPEPAPDTPQPTPPCPDDEQQDIVLPDDHPIVKDWHDEPPAETYRVGKGNPPRHTQFKPGQSGNPRGPKKIVQPPPATLMSLIGKTLFEDIANLMRSSLSDLTVSADDIALQALAKQIVSDAIKREGRSRSMIIDHFMEPQRGSDRYKERDRGAQEADRMSDMIRAIIDPHLTDQQLTALMERLKAEAEFMQFDSEKPSGELPPLPPPPRRRTKRKSR